MFGGNLYCMNDADKTELVRLYREDRLGITRLSRQFGVSVRTACNILDRAGVPRVGRSVLSGVADKEDRIVALYSEGQTQGAIGRSVGVGQTTVGRVLRRRGVDVMRNVGARHGNWKGGRHLSGGYFGVRLSNNDPMWVMANSSGYVLEHRLVMARSLGRPLLPGETVHHVNGDKTDNRLENLQLRFGNHGKGGVLRCRACGSNDIEHAELATVE